MNQNDTFEKRKQLRLKNFDYSSNGAYFVTVCTCERRRILSDIVVGAIHESPAVKLTNFGKIAEITLCALSDKYKNVTILNYVIMPDHVHFIVVLHDAERAIRESPLQKRSELSKIVGFFKATVSKNINKTYSKTTLWQRGYYEHIIRSENDMSEICNYIKTNPQKWANENK